MNRVAVVVCMVLLNFAEMLRGAFTGQSLWHCQGKYIRGNTSFCDFKYLAALAPKPPFKQAKPRGSFAFRLIGDDDGRA
jgi:hypothetical protein